MGEHQNHAGSFEKTKTPCLYRYSSNGVYYAVVRHQGKLFRRSLRTDDYAKAKRDLADFKRDLMRVDWHSGKITVGELLSKFETSLLNLDSNTIAKLGYVVKNFREHWRPGLKQQVHDVKPSHVLEWLGKQRERYSRSYYNDHVQFVKRMFDFAVDDRMIANSPAAGAITVKRGSVIRTTPTWEQFKAIVADIRAQQFNADAQASGDFVEFLGLSGLGNSEAASLRRQDVDLENSKITVYRNKTDEGFQIPIYPQLRPLVEKLMAETEKGKPDTQLLKIKNAKHAIWNACKRLSFPKFSHRSLRRCFCTRAIELGIDFKTVAAMQGHRDGGVLVAKTYSHLRAEHVDKMALRLTENELAKVENLESKEKNAN